jgi:hypothetical protein
MTTTKRPAPARKPASRTTTTDTDSIAIATVDREIVGSVDESIWRALFDGHFRLAVPCEICGRPLVTLASKMARRGPRCAASAGDSI